MKFLKKWALFRNLNIRQFAKMKKTWNSLSTVEKVAVKKYITEKMKHEEEHNADSNTRPTVRPE